MRKSITPRNFAWIYAGAIFAGSLVFFLLFSRFPSTHNYDEAHYIPAAVELLQGKADRNLEHPPLAKELMAVGISLLGDQPLGWRVMSAVFGALTLCGMFFLANVFFGRLDLALWTALLTLSNHFIFVQARIGMLDTFMEGFLIWALGLFSKALMDADLRREERDRILVFSGLLFGFATACKWFAAVPWACCFGLSLALNSRPRWKPAILAWVIAPFTAYFISFLPFLMLRGRGILDFFPLHHQMWTAQQWVIGTHPYMSHWLGWPIIARPIWYAFEVLPSRADLFRGVVLIGNPLLMWSGLLGLVYCVYGALKHLDRMAALICFLYGIQYFSWLFIPRKLLFYYYYYPASLMLSLAVAYFFSRHEKLKWWYLAAAGLVFAYFFPVLAGLPVSVGDFQRWIWFKSWT